MHPEEKRALYDQACLSTAKTYYEKFASTYPQDAKRLGVDGIIKEIGEQQAEKQLAIAQYYHRTGHIQSANLYYDLVANDYPQTRAAEAARQGRAGRIQP